MNIPVGTDTPRPNMLVDGMLRDYVTEDKLYKIDQYKDGQWVNIITKEWSDDYDAGSTE